MPPQTQPRLPGGDYPGDITTSLHIAAPPAGGIFLLFCSRQGYERRAQGSNRAGWFIMCSLSAYNQNRAPTGPCGVCRPQMAKRRKMTVCFGRSVYLTENTSQPPSVPAVSRDPAQIRPSGLHGERRHREAPADSAAWRKREKRTSCRRSAARGGLLPVDWRQPVQRRLSAASSATRDTWGCI